MSTLALLITSLVALAPQDAVAPAPAVYDPLSVSQQDAPRTLSLTVHDAARTRDIPLRVYLPADATPAPLLLFSHGLGGSCENNPYLGRHWSARGYAVVHLQHPGSDESVWRDVPRGERFTELQQAANGKNLLLRVGDVKVVLDQLTQWQATEGHPLHGRLDLEHVGMSGHSFGAITTQVVAGQTMPLLGEKHREARIDAALALSPSSPRAGDAAHAFAPVRVPWMLMTGTRDDSPIGGQDVASRLAVFPALPPTIDRYELVLHDALHSAFSERALPGDRGERNPNHHRAVQALSTAFFDAHLRGDAAARAWLHGAGAREVLEADDRWRAEPAASQAARKVVVR